jgi:hypothetical protein
MDRTQRRLVGLLAVQLVLLAIVHWPFSRARSSGGEKLLATLGSVSPERIEIAGGEGSSVTLERRAGAWVLGSLAGYPVAPGKVEKLIQDLGHLTAGRPVASARGSHAALKVASDQFERRLRIWARASKSPTAELFVGSSAGSGASHVRVGGSDRVFEASGLSAYDVPAEAGSWIERDLVPVRAEEVTGFEVANRNGSFALASENGAWRVRMPAARVRATLDSSKVIELVRGLCGIPIDQPAGPMDERAQGLTAPEATVRLTAKVGGSGGAGSPPAVVTIRIGAPVPAKPDSRYATCSGKDFAVIVPKYSFDRALSVELKELVKK